MDYITLDYVKKIFPKRNDDSNKGDYGRLFCLCGSYCMAGAAIMAAKSAIKSGVGIVDVALDNSIYPIVASNVVEAVYTIIDDEFNLTDCLNKSSACVVGCGLSINDKTRKIVKDVISYKDIPIVIDADGINIISENIDILKTAGENIILTPHLKEMSRILLEDVSVIKNNKCEIAKNFASKFKISLVLKDHETVIALPNGEVYLNNIGNAGMAKGGSGDVLSGMISSFLAQGMNIKDALLCGVYLHAKAGDNCARKLSKVSMTPIDIINELPNVFLEINR